MGNKYMTCCSNQSWENVDEDTIKKKNRPTIQDNTVGVKLRRKSKTSMDCKYQALQLQIIPDQQFDSSNLKMRVSQQNSKQNSRRNSNRQIHHSGPRASKEQLLQGVVESIIEGLQLEQQHKVQQHSLNQQQEQRINQQDNQSNKCNDKEKSQMEEVYDVKQEIKAEEINQLDDQFKEPINKQSQNEQTRVEENEKAQNERDKELDEEKTSLDFGKIAAEGYSSIQQKEMTDPSIGENSNKESPENHQPSNQQTIIDDSKKSINFPIVELVDENNDDSQKNDSNSHKLSRNRQIPAHFLNSMPMLPISKTDEQEVNIGASFEGESSNNQDEQSVKSETKKRIVKKKKKKNMASETSVDNVSQNSQQQKKRQIIKKIKLTKIQESINDGNNENNKQLLLVEDNNVQ